ncbi:hypothetical protein SSX86_033187 [Deinandra increscens subsp. villosa]|uniref:Uncharacterized protein n=1 Tax=Deinandra increscens subsp. villosa TaxID=3103831 RepID=A0AAP0GGC3_9ASTR
MSSKINPGNFVSIVVPASIHGQPSHVDQNIEKIVTRENIVRKIEESKAQAADPIPPPSSVAPTTITNSPRPQIQQQSTAGELSKSIRSRRLPNQEILDGNGVFEVRSGVGGAEKCDGIGRDGV